MANEGFIIFIISSEEQFPSGVQQIYLYQKLALKVFIVSPGRFYHSTRKLNMVELDLGFKYIYTLGWVKLCVSNIYFSD